MPGVHNLKSRAIGFYDEARKGRGRPANSQCSWYVRLAATAMTIAWGIEIDLQTVICQVPSVSRAIVAAAKLQKPADASKTLRWRPFNQA
jgi:hypothetical protein